MSRSEFQRFLVIFAAVIAGDVVTSLLVFAVTKR